MAGMNAARILSRVAALLFLLLYFLSSEPKSFRATRHQSYGDAAFLLQCPLGRYQSTWGAADANERLQAHWRRLLELGYRPRSNSASFSSRAAYKRAEARGFVTYESGLWPRPPHCDVVRPGVHSVLDEPPGTCEPNGTVCDKYRISRRYGFVWHHLWKGGTTALSPYLTCNFGAEPVANLLHDLPERDGLLHVGTSREPMRRFLSGFQEVFMRVRVRHRSRPQQLALHDVPTDSFRMRTAGGLGNGGRGRRPAGWCHTAKHSLDVVPGQSWGRLSEEQIRVWKRRRCDRFFCAPSAMEAVGKYRCAPLGEAAKAGAAETDATETLAEASSAVARLQKPSPQLPPAPRAGEEPSRKCFHRRVPWLLVAAQPSSGGAVHEQLGLSESPNPTACTDAEEPISRDALKAIFRQFVADLECGTQFANGQHLFTQALFLGGNTSVPRPLDFLLRLESLASDLDVLKTYVSYNGDGAGGGKGEGGRGSCPLHTERSASEKPPAVPRPPVLLELLAEDAALLQSVCNIYMQDFICLGYPLPKGCKLLPAKAALPPPTMNLTAEMVFGGHHHRRRRRQRNRRRELARS